MADSSCDLFRPTLYNFSKSDRRPSLYASIRLARFVYRVKERLKCRAQQHIRRKHDDTLAPKSLQAQARRKWDQPCTKGSHRDPAGAILKVEKQLQHQFPLYVHECCQEDCATQLPRHPRLLQYRDDRVSSIEPRTSIVAACDRLFLSYDVRLFTRQKGVDEFRRLYDLTTLLLVRLPLLICSTATECWPSDSSVLTPGFLSGGKATAKLEHVLCCLRQAALEALIFRELESFEEVVEEWHQHWLQGRQLDYGWFLEWPNGCRPLSTTWPWNVRPSLVVLWGVCWMFYDNATKSAEQMRQQLETDRRVGPSAWMMRPAPQSATMSQRNTGNTSMWVPAASNNTSFQESAWLQIEGEESIHAGLVARRANGTPDFDSTLHGYQSSLPTTQSPYIAHHPFRLSHPDPDPPYVWSQNQSSYSLPVLPHTPEVNTFPVFPPVHRHFAPSSVPHLGPVFSDWQDHIFNEPQQPSVPPTRRIDYSGSTQPYVPLSQQANSEGDDKAAVVFSPNLRPPMAHAQTYPSPHSDVSRDETRSSCFSLLPSNDMSPSMMFAASPSVESHRSRPSTAEKGDDPPRNATGQITCVHPNCENVEPVFSRRCEWTKHMDKHTRPYVCKLPGCEKISGFTYSGGLSRHQREVHREHGGPKACYMCPHQDCKRSTGSGFSRKENLQEHLRRVHRQVTEGEADLQAINSANIQATTGPKRRRGRLDDEDDQLAEPVFHEARKRKRQDEDEEDDDADDEYRKEDLSAQVKRLRKELREKDERLRKLEQTVELLTRRNV